ncbi:MAG: C40 family peptidase [Candidatus Eisenbacteria bacterium]|nr:C40 family peptidase [Candidatus Eisenbacteria bacterium]
MAPIHREADPCSERVSDAALGTPVRLLSTGPDWCRLRTPDGYEGYARTPGLRPCAAARARAFAGGMVVQAVSSELRFAVPGRPGLHLPAGARVVRVRTAARRTLVELPDGSRGHLPSGALARPGRFSRRSLVENALRFTGVPYVWGGRTGWGLDCSGLVQLAAELAGTALPRDARDQVRRGSAVGLSRAQALRAGDLLFFGKSDSSITHVAIYLGAAKYVHAFGQVRVNSLRPQDVDYLDELPGYFRCARRLPESPSGGAAR